MLGAEFFNHNQLRRFLIAFGSFFNTMEIRRLDDTNAEIQRMIVPLEYGPKERWLVRLREDPNFLQGVSIIVPRMSYEIHGVAYDGSRHLNSLNPLAFPTAAQKQLARIYVGVPYTLSFELSILTKTQQDALQIVEQILPFFTPDLTFQMVTIPELGFPEQIPLTLVSVSESDNYEGDFLHRRAIIWTLGFTMKVNFYGPVKAVGRIEEVLVDVYNSPLNAILDPPEIMATEDGHVLTLEDGTGHIVDESTANTYFTGRVVRIDVVATDPNQDPTDPIQSTTTITETPGDVRRNSLGDDESL